MSTYVHMLCMYDIWRWEESHGYVGCLMDLFVFMADQCHRILAGHLAQAPDGARQILWGALLIKACNVQDLPLSF